MKSLTDVVSGAGLSGYAEIALVIFLIAFIGVVISLFLPGRQRTYEHLRQLPMDRDASLTPLARDGEDPSLRRLRSSGEALAQDDNHA
jgi:cbb3-type cytochrome oxidase subunit 3